MSPKDEEKDEYVDGEDYDDEDEDEDDDPDTFRIVEPHPEPTTELFTTEKLHSASNYITCITFTDVWSRIYSSRHG